MTTHPEFPFAAEPAAADDVRFERDGAWFVARPAVLKTGGSVIVTGSQSKLSFADAERMLRRMLDFTR